MISWAAVTGIITLLRTRATQFATGPFAKAFGIVLAVLVVVAAIALGLRWVHTNAVEKTDAKWELRMAQARADDALVALARMRRAEQVGRMREAKRAAEAAAAQDRVAELEELLKKRPRTLAYPNDVIPRINR